MSVLWLGQDDFGWGRTLVISFGCTSIAVTLVALDAISNIYVWFAERAGPCIEYASYLEAAVWIEYKGLAIDWRKGGKIV
jgi:hypothetical protein